MIVVLADRDKEKLEHEFETAFEQSKLFGTKVIFRSGSPLLPSDLRRVSAQHAKVSVILAPAGDPDIADSLTLRSVLALKALATSPTGLHGFVVAEVRDIDNEPLVRLVGGRTVETMVSHDVLGRLMVMSARQPGLAKVYTGIFGFDGDEFYIKEWPELVGVPFGELVERFSSAIPIGVRLETSSDGTAGRVLLNPPAERPMAPGEELIVIAEDDNTYAPAPPVALSPSAFVTPRRAPRRPETILLCNMRRDVDDLVDYLDGLVAPGSEVHFLAAIPKDEQRQRLIEGGLEVAEVGGGRSCVSIVADSSSSFVGCAGVRRGRRGSSDSTDSQWP